MPTPFAQLVTVLDEHAHACPNNVLRLMTAIVQSGPPYLHPMLSLQDESDHLTWPQAIAFILYESKDATLRDIGSLFIGAVAQVASRDIREFVTHLGDAEYQTFVRLLTEATAN